MIPTLMKSGKKTKEAAVAEAFLSDSKALYLYLYLYLYLPPERSSSSSVSSAPPRTAALPGLFTTAARPSSTEPPSAEWRAVVARAFSDHSLSPASRLPFQFHFILCHSLSLPLI